MRTSPLFARQNIAHLFVTLLIAGTALATRGADIGRERAIQRHLQDGDEYRMNLRDLLAHGQKLFNANWTREEGGGRPLTKGNGNPLANRNAPLVFPRNFNRISAPDANSCAGCHNSPVSGGNGDIVANVFVLGQRFDFATFGNALSAPTESSFDERGEPVTLQSIANSRATLGMFGSGYIEMLARQMTVDLQAIAKATAPGTTNFLRSKGVEFGLLIHRADGTWDTSQVVGIPAPSLTTPSNQPPSLIIRPFHQAGNVVSIRQFSNNAFNHHHGIQSSERFGTRADADGDGFTNELSRADVTAVSFFQATMAVPGRVIPHDPEIEQAILVGEAKFSSIGCAVCHVPNLSLTKNGWLYSEPNPFNPEGNLIVGKAQTMVVDLGKSELPQPRLKVSKGDFVHVPAFTDLKLHDITSGLGDFNMENLDMNQAVGSPGFFAGNRKFLTRKLWGVGTKPNYFHHGQYTTIREAILAHSGEALSSRLEFQQASEYERDCVVEFLKSLQNLPPGTPNRIVDETGQAREWPPEPEMSIVEEAGSVHLTWNGNTGIEAEARVFQVQQCHDLEDPAWESLGVPTSQAELVVPKASEATFYRVVALN